MTKFIPRDKLEHLIWKPADALPTSKQQPAPAQPPQSTAALEGSYILMDQTDTYAKGVHALRKASQKYTASPHPTFTKSDGSQIYRPLTFKEVIQARVTDYNTLLDEEGNERTLEGRLRFFKKWIDSCTGMAYKANTTKFKLINVCPELITISKGFNDNFLSINYDSVTGIELDSSKGKYDESLTKKEVINHKAWLAAVEEDKVLLKEYCDIVFDQLKKKYGRDTGIGFYFFDVGEDDELRALFVDSLNNNSNAGGFSYLNLSGSFLLVAPSREKK